MTGHLTIFQLLSLPMIHSAQLSPDIHYRYELIAREISVIPKFPSFHHSWKKEAVNEKTTYISFVRSLATFSSSSGRFTFFHGNLRADQIYHRILQSGCYEENIKSTSYFMIFLDIKLYIKFPFYLLCYIYIYCIYNSLRIVEVSAFVTFEKNYRIIQQLSQFWRQIDPCDTLDNLAP